MSRTRVWPKRPGRWSDTFKRRVEVRLAYLGWTQDQLGAALAIVEGRGTPYDSASLRPYFSGRRNVDGMKKRLAVAMGVTVLSLTPGESFDGLLVASTRRFPNRDPVSEAEAEAEA